GFVIVRFRGAVCGACLDRPHTHRDVPVACEEYDRHLRPRFRKLLLQIEAIQPGEVHIQHQAAGEVGSRCSQECLARRKCSCHQPGGTNQSCDAFPCGLIVVHHINQSSCVTHGISLVELSCLGCRFPFQCSLNGIEQIILTERFNQVRNSRIRESVRLCTVVRCVGRDEDHRHLTATRYQKAVELDPAHPGQPHIQDVTVRHAKTG